MGAACSVRVTAYTVPSTIVWPVIYVYVYYTNICNYKTLHDLSYIQHQVWYAIHTLVIQSTLTFNPQNVTKSVLTRDILISE